MVSLGLLLKIIRIFVLNLVSLPAWRLLEITKRDLRRRCLKWSAKYGIAKHYDLENR